MWNHFANAKFNRSSGQKLYDDMRKYPRSAFSVGIITRCVDCHEGLEEEARQIEALKPEYNIILGVKKHIRLDGLQHITDEGRAAIARYAQYEHPILRPIVCLDDGNKFRSVSEAERFYGLKKGAVYHACDRGGTAAGRKFKYVEDA
jgi:hypothetical protein